MLFLNNMAIPLRGVETRKDILCVRFSDLQWSSICAGPLQHYIETRDPDYDPANSSEWLGSITEWDPFIERGISRVYKNRSFLIRESALVDHIREYQSIQLILDMLPNLEIMILVGDGKYLREITEHLATELGVRYHFIECNYTYPRQWPRIKVHSMSMVLELIDTIFIQSVGKYYNSFDRINLSNDILQILEKLRSDVLTEYSNILYQNLQTR